MRIPVGIDPSEVWEVDFCLEAGRFAVEAWRETLARAREVEAAAMVGAEKGVGDDEEGAVKAKQAQAEAAEKVAAAERGLAAAEADLASYVPGTGPTFVVGHIPGARRAEIAGMMADTRAAKTDRERFPAEQAWRREVVRWAVRGHRGLFRRDGSEQAFDGRQVALAGETITQPTERQLEVYVGAGMLGDLCSICLRPQGLDEAGKNG